MYEFYENYKIYNFFYIYEHKHIGGFPSCISLPLILSIFGSFWKIFNILRPLSNLYIESLMIIILSRSTCGERKLCYNEVLMGG